MNEHTNTIARGLSADLTRFLASAAGGSFRAIPSIEDATTSAVQAHKFAQLWNEGIALLVDDQIGWAEEPRTDTLRTGVRLWVRRRNKIISATSLGEMVRRIRLRRQVRGLPAPAVAKTQRSLHDLLHGTILFEQVRRLYPVVSATDRQEPFRRLLSKAEKKAARKAAVAPASMADVDKLLPKEVWQELEVLLPADRPRGCPNRHMLRGIVTVLGLGLRWEDLPNRLRLGSGSTCLKRLREWQLLTNWATVKSTLVEHLQRPDVEERLAIRSGVKQSRKKRASAKR